MKVQLREGCKLSATYANSPNHYKVVEVGNVLAYVVSGGGRGAAYVTALYRADIHVKIGKTWHVTSSFEYGERLNGYTFQEDSEGCTFANIAWQAVNGLESRAAMRQLIAEHEKQKRRKKTAAKPKTRRECKACGGSGDADYLRQDNASGPGTPGPACKACNGKGYIKIKRKK